MDGSNDSELVFDYFAGNLSPQQLQQLYVRLIDDRALTNELVRAAAEESIISEWVRTRQLRLATEQHRQLPAISSETIPQPTPLLRFWVSVQRTAGWCRVHWKIASLTTLAATVLMVLSISYLNSSPEHEATLVRADNAKFETGKEIPLGARLVAGSRLQLVSGSVELVGRTGARVILQAPADYTLVSAGVGQLRHGTLSVDASNVNGYQIETPSGIVTDLGTRFAVSFLNDQATEIEVLRGKVLAEFRSNAAEPSKRELSKGNTVRIDALNNQIEQVVGGLAVFDEVKQLMKRKTIEASADHYVCGGEQSNQVQSANTDAGMVLKRDPWRRLSVCRKVYIKFSLAGENVIDNSAATFSFRYANDPAPGSKNRRYVGKLGVYVLKRSTAQSEFDWQENSLTWNSAPANNTADASTLTNQAELIGSIDVDTSPEKRRSGIDNSYSIQVPQLSEYLQPDGSATFVLTVLEQKDFEPVLFVVPHESSDYAGPLLTFETRAE